MTCRELTEFLGFYIDGELPAEMKREFEAHIRICPDCQAYLTSYTRTVDLARGMGAESEPAEIPEDVVTAILAACGMDKPGRGTH